MNTDYNTKSTVFQAGHIAEGYVCSLEECTGCLACKAVCSKDAINIESDEHLHTIPRIDTSKCITCHRCEKVCPTLNPVKLNDPVDNVYACWNKDTKKRLQSISGGMSYILSKAFVRYGGYFVGCESSSKEVKHTICNQINDLSKYQGSKYVQSNIEDTYPGILQLLKSGKKVLFSGTPCQVAAIKSFLGKEYDNFYCIDLVCHGVPSSLLRKQWLEGKSRQFGEKILDMKFRVKYPDQLYSAIQYIYSDGRIEMIPLPDDVYFLSFVFNYTLRESCYRCKYAQLSRVGDVTLADFWGYYPKKLRFLSFRKGTSMMMINNAKGEYLNYLAKNEVVFDKRDVKEAIDGNLNLHSPQKRPDNQGEFWNMVREMGIYNVPKDFFPVFPMEKTTIKAKVRTYFMIFLPPSLIEIIRRIKQSLYF